MSGLNLVFFSLSLFCLWCLLLRAIGLIKKFEMNQLNYRLSHPVAALQSSLAKDMDKYSRIRFDYASFDAQVFGKQPLMGANQEPEMLADGQFCFFNFYCYRMLVFLLVKNVL